MSFRTMAWAWEQRQLTPVQRLTLLSLADHANAEGVCWPFVKTVASDAHCSERSVERSIVELAELGLVTIEHQYREDGSLRASLYHLHVAAPPSATPAPPSRLPDATPGAPVAPPGAPVAEQEPRHVTQSIENRVTEPGHRKDDARARASQRDAGARWTEKFKPDDDPPWAPLGRIPPPKLPPGVTVPPLNRTVNEEFLVKLIADWADDLGGPERVRQLIHQAMYGRDVDHMVNPRQYLTFTVQQAAKEARRGPH